MGGNHRQSTGTPDMVRKWLVSWPRPVGDAWWSCGGLYSLRASVLEESKMITSESDQKPFGDRVGDRVTSLDLSCISKWNLICNQAIYHSKSLVECDSMPETETFDCGEVLLTQHEVGQVFSTRSAFPSPLVAFVSSTLFINRVGLAYRCGDLFELHKASCLREHRCIHPSIRPWIRSQRRSSE